MFLIFVIFVVLVQFYIVIAFYQFSWSYRSQLNCLSVCLPFCFSASVCLKKELVILLTFCRNFFGISQMARRNHLFTIFLQYILPCVQSFFLILYFLRSVEYFLTKFCADVLGITVTATILYKGKARKLNKFISLAKVL